MFEVEVVVVVVGANGLPPCGLTLLCPNLRVWGFGVVAVCLTQVYMGKEMSYKVWLGLAE